MSLSFLTWQNLHRHDENAKHCPASMRISMPEKNIYPALNFGLVALPVLQRTGRWGAKHSFFSARGEGKYTAATNMKSKRGSTSYCENILIENTTAAPESVHLTLAIKQTAI